MLFLLILCGISLKYACVDAACSGPLCQDIRHTEHGRTLLEGSCVEKQYPTSREAIQPVTLQDRVRDIHWTGAKHERDKHIFVVTTGLQGSLWHSSEHGKTGTFSDITSQLPGISDVPPGRLSSYSGVLKIHQHRLLPGKFLVQGAGLRHWVTEDFGNTFTAVGGLGDSIGFYHTLKLHPNKPDWILALAQRSTCLKAFDRWCAQDLFVSQEDAAAVINAKVVVFNTVQDFGGSWLNLTENSKGKIAAFMDFDWGAAMHRGQRQDVVDQTILATAYESIEHLRDRPFDWDENLHLVISHDFFSSPHQKVVSCGNQFEVVGNKAANWRLSINQAFNASCLLLSIEAGTSFICTGKTEDAELSSAQTVSLQIKHGVASQAFVVQVYLALPTTCPKFPDGGKRDVCREPTSGAVIMYVSDDEAQSFTQACVPTRDFDLAYSMLPSHGGETSFLMIDHDEQEFITGAAPISSVYSAGQGSSMFSLSLPRVYQQGKVDFSRVEGVPGVYLANQVGPEAFAEEQFFAYERYISTKITLNGGAKWQDLEKPSSFRHAECNRCTEMSDPSKCRLHLHGPAHYYTGPGSRPSFYSHYNALGVVMAVGNTGEHLDMAADRICTWISSDAGMTWRDVSPRANIYEFGDLGGILMVGSYETDEPAQKLFFSLDQGACWQSIQLSEAIDVSNIRVEPTASSTVFIVHGTACKKRADRPTCSRDKQTARPAGKMYVIDVAEIMGSDLKVCEPGDYEMWSPPSPESCLLGRNYTLHRRKPAASCFNAKGWERPQNTSHSCPCQAADVGCEFGYETVGDDCVPIPGIAAETCPALKQGKYKISETHKRLVQGNICSDVERVIPDTDGKGGTKSKSSHHGWVFWVLGTLVGASLPFYN